MTTNEGQELRSSPNPQRAATASSALIPPASDSQHFAALEGVPFEFMKHLTTIRAHAMSLHNGDSEVLDVTACITINVVELATAIRAALTKQSDMLAALQAIESRIDSASGSPSFTAGEHDDLCALIAKASTP